jgi:phage baseplate assembly protein W
MELKLKDGDYVPDGRGGFVRLSGREALAQRLAFRLTARRGSFPFLPELGSQLYRLGRCSAGQRAAEAERAVTEALESEPEVQVVSVTLTESGGQALVETELRYQGENLAVTVTVQ